MENAQHIVDCIYKGIFQIEEMLLAELSGKEFWLLSSLLRKIAEDAIKKQISFLHTYIGAYV